MSTLRSEVLGLAAQAVNVERQATQGEAAQGFGLIAAYWSAHLDHPVSATEVAAMLGLLKFARAKANPTHLDNWVDVAGYAALGGELADGQKV